MKKPLVSLLLSALLLALCLAGCQKTGDPRREEGVIAVGIGQDLNSSLSPYQLTTAGTREVMFNVYEGLYKPAFDGSLVPALAETVAVSDDGLVYTFTLRGGVTFHNGKKLSAADVVWSYETCRDTTTDANVKSILTGTVESVRAADDRTVVITLKQRDGDFLAYAASVYIVPSGYDKLDTEPVGTGPFRYVSRKVQEEIVFARYDSYWGSKARLKQVTFKVYESGTALVMALDAGTIDMAAHLTGAQIKGLSDRYTVLEGTMNLVQGLYLNNRVAPLNDVRVRRALAYAIDTDQMMKLTADGRGTKVGSAMYPAFGKYFDDSLTDLYKTDAARARQLLAEAGYPDGFDLTIIAPSNYTPHVDTAQVLAEQLKAVGVRATVREVEWNTWVSDIYAGRQFEATVCGFDASTMTAGAMLNRYVSDSSKNMCGFSSPEYDALMAQAASLNDDARRTELYREAERVLAEECASVFLQDMADFVAVRTGLTGYRFYPLYVMDLSTVGWEN
ncbi:MAG: ABC transporter substrate-binding protein [Lachnospiraceae bacterium]|nr:ABC transporter substrate-binding protein [Lachnospiraceae bacterium]